MHNTFRQSAIAMLLLMLAAGCSGKSLNRMLTVPTTPNTYYGGYDARYYPSTWPADPGYRTDPLVRFPSGTRLANYEVGNILSRHLTEFSGAFGGNFATLHLQLPFGNSNVNPPRYVMASPNVAVSASSDGSVPRQLQYSLNLLSARDTVSFVTYGLYAPDSNQHVVGVDLSGAASFGIGEEHGLYVGVRQFGEPSYNWYGPFKASERWHVDALRDSNYTGGTAAYVTLAVFKGDTVRVDGLKFDLGG
jgi:hypothetical protein